MQLDVLQELQARGRFFWEIFPGAQAADKWQRQRDQLERTERRGEACLPPATPGRPIEDELEVANSR